jgi:L-ascorbate metabolism protein UlaG (beta-lactamase superfamily)
LVVRYIGHATVLIELDGVRFLTDPLLRKRIAILWRAVPLGTIDEVDAVLISHGHYDHLDLPSLRKLEARIVVPRGLGARLGGFDVVEVDEGDELTVGPVVVRTTHAEHDGGRPLFGDGPAFGYAILGSRRVFFVRRLRPKIAVPIHWGAYRPFHRSSRAAFLSEPAEAFARATAIAAPGVEARVLRPGEQLEL